jgi:hypothetical protein
MRQAGLDADRVQSADEVAWDDDDDDDGGSSTAPEGSGTALVTTYAKSWKERVKPLATRVSPCVPLL